MTNRINYVIKNFINFLNRSLPVFNDIKQFFDDEFLFDEQRNDFFQANWEILVESLICAAGEEFLEAYGDGADCNGASSRVFLPDKIPTHKIKCITKDQGTILDLITGVSIDLSNLTFHSFVNFENGNWSYTSPLNAILLENDMDKTICVVKMDNVNFEKSKY